MKVGSDNRPPTEDNENEACDAMIDGVDAKITTCGKLGNLMILQLKDESLDQLHLRDLQIHVATPECPS